VPDKLASIAPGGSVGALLRAVRRQADLSQRQLAAMVGVSRRTVERAESGEAQGVTVGLVAQILASVGFAVHTPPTSISGYRDDGWTGGGQAVQHPRGPDPRPAATAALHVRQIATGA
jgi:transcriptional regulator with XRE-family HTH domain